MKILTAKQTRTAEQLAFQSGLSGARLMENAGSAATRVMQAEFSLKGKRVVVVAGSGNNGGDGFVVARKCKEYGANVLIILAMGLPTTADSSEMLSRAKQAEVSVWNYYDNPELSLLQIQTADLLVDAVFGIGFHGAADREIGEIFRQINDSTAACISLDLPSGLCCDEGEVKGSAVIADLTVSFMGYKPCHFLFPSVEFCGKTVAVSIGFSTEHLPDVYGEVWEEKNAFDALVPIPPNAHKGTKGTAVIVGGSYGMAGAPLLAARAAMRTGAGLVRVCLPQSVYLGTMACLPEAVFLPMSEKDGCLSVDSFSSKLLDKASALLIGCGMSTGESAVQTVHHLLSQTKVPTVLDADGLNAVADDPSVLKVCRAPLILTPHPGEMARLCHSTVSEIEKKRVFYARKFAVEQKVITVLKGAYTVIASPCGRLFVNTTGNEAMATAGSGDMLAGMITALLANGTNPLSAAVAGVYFHGAVGDLAAEKMGKRGVLTSDMIELLPKIWNKR